MRLKCELPASDLRALAAVLPALLRWWRGLEPDQDGRLPTDEDIRLVAGSHGRTGAGYEVRVPAAVPDADPTTARVTITEDAADLLEAAYAAEGVDAVVRVVDPGLPGAVHLGLRGRHRELAVLGGEYTATGSLHAAAVERDGDLAFGEVRFKRLVVTARATTTRRRDRVRVRVRVRISPRGVLRPAALAVFFLRRKLERDTQPQLDAAVARLSAAVAAGELDSAVRELLLSPRRGPAA